MCAVLTVRKVGVTTGDTLGAVARAAYLLAEVEAPGAFAGEYGEGMPGRLSDGSPNSMWLGSEAALEKLGVGLGQKVEIDTLALAFLGLSTHGERLRSPSHDRINSVELQLAVPKSVSNVWAAAEADPELRAAIERLILRAANRTVAYLLGTKNILFVGKDGAQALHAPAEGFVAAAALHSNSRVAEGEVIPAPQLHVHFDVVGVLHPDGSLRTPAPRALFADGAPVEGAAVFGSIISQGLVDELGFEVATGVGSKGRYFEIVGVPEEAIARGSGRTQQIERQRVAREAALGRLMSGVERAGLALTNRRGKDAQLSPELISSARRADMAECGLTLERVRALRRVRPKASLQWRRARARRVALERFRERGPTVTLGEANAIVLEAGEATLSVRQANELLADMQRSGEVVALEGGLVTTRQIREQQRRIMDGVLGAAARGGRRISPGALQAGLERTREALGYELEGEKLDAVRKLCSGVGIGVLHGRAGTGKSGVLRAMAEASAADGWQVIAAGPDSATQQLMARDLGVPSYTLASLIPAVKRGTIELDEQTKLIIDEAGKVSADDWDQIIPWLERHRIELILSGHIGQHDAILLPGMFREIVRQRDRNGALTEVLVEVAELTEIRRHKLEWHKELQVAVDMGDGPRAVELLRSNEAMTVSRGSEEAMERTLNRWDSRRHAHQDPRDTIMVVSGSNDDVDRLNVLAQERRLANHELGDSCVKAVDRDYQIHVGDTVILSAAPYRARAEPGAQPPARVANGAIGIVNGVDPQQDRVRVAFAEPGGGNREVVIDQRALRERARAARRGERIPALRLGYAYHTFPVQGATVQDVYFCLITLPGKNGFYVGITRQRGQLHIDLHSSYRGRLTPEQVLERLARCIDKTDAPELGIDRRETPSPVAERLPAVPPSPFDLVSAESRSQLELPERPTILARIADALGPERAMELAERARSHAAEMSALDDQHVEEIAVHGRRALEHLNVNVARKVRSNTKRTRTVADRLEYSRGKAELFETEAAGRSKFRDRGDRESFREAAAAHRDSAGRYLEQLVLLGSERMMLEGDPDHPDRWLERWEPDIARAIAAQREQRARLGREAPVDLGMEVAELSHGAEPPELVA